MTDTNTAPLPRSIAWLGYGGLIPFIVLMPASLIDHHNGALWSDALYAYGAVILSFVGALHWGFAMTLPALDERQRTMLFVWSVIPALIAWPSLLFSAPIAAPLLIVGYIAHYLQDRRLVLTQQARLPAWYLPLRLRLSSVAIVCLALGTFAAGHGGLT